MKAIKYLRPGVGLVETKDRSIKNDDDVLVKVEYCAICGSDRHVLNGLYDHLFPQTGGLMGHEAAGEVVELGPKAKVKGLKVGDKVALYFNKYCGSCFYCRSGREHLCDHVRADMRAMAEYYVMSEQAVYKLPEGMSTLEGCLAEPVSVCVHGVDLMGIKPGENAAVFGAGSLGLISLQLMKMAGATGLTVIEPIQSKRELALELGADYVLDPTAPDFKEKVDACTEGRGFQSVMEISGSIKGVESAIEAVGRGGTLVCLALYPENYHLPLDMYRLHEKELTVKGVYQSPYVFPRTLALMPKLNLKPLINDVYPMEEVEAAFEAQKSGKYPKIILKIAD